jgi:hypothetical protein
MNICRALFCFGACPPGTWRCFGCTAFLFGSGHSQGGKEVERLILIDQVRPFGVEPDEMRAILAVIAADAVLDAEQVGICAIRTFSKRNADLGYSNAARLADGEEILAFDIVRATIKSSIALAESVYAAAHEKVRACACVSLNLFEALIHPVDAIAAMNHPDYFDPFRRCTQSFLMVCLDRAIPRAPGGTSPVMQLPAAI